jgi:hypothetical protein
MCKGAGQARAQALIYKDPDRNNLMKIRSLSRSGGTEPQ